MSESNHAATSDQSTAAAPAAAGPVTLPVTVDQYETLVARGDFDQISGQVELIFGRIVRMNPQGPQHADPIDWLTEWSIEQAERQFTIRVEKPIIIPDHHSCPEPDVAWVTRRRYADRHPVPADIHLLMEVSHSSGDFDRLEKMQLYAAASIPEYWQIDIPSQTVTVHQQPAGSCYLSVQSFAANSKLHPRCRPAATLDVGALFAG